MYKSISKHTSLNLNFAETFDTIFQRKPKPYGQDENIVCFFFAIREHFFWLRHDIRTYINHNITALSEKHTQCLPVHIYDDMLWGHKKSKAGCKNVADENKQNPCLCSTQTFYWMKSVTHSGSPNRKRFILHRLLYIVSRVITIYRLFI